MAQGKPSAGAFAHAPGEGPAPSPTLHVCGTHHRVETAYEENLMKASDAALRHYLAEQLNEEQLDEWLAAPGGFQPERRYVIRCAKALR